MILALTVYFSCILCWVAPLPNLFKILNAKGAASSLVGLFIFSSMINSDLGLGFIVILIWSALLSDRSTFFCAGTGSSVLMV